MYKSNCKNCGAPLKQHLRECEYCGTENPNFNVLKIETYYNYPITLHAAKCVEAEAFDRYPKDVTRYLMNELSNDITKEIMNYVDVEREFDQKTYQYIFRARLKVFCSK